MTKLIQLYDYEECRKKINTMYGMIEYEEWIMREASRIGDRPDRKVKITREGTKISLLVNRMGFLR